MIATRKMSSARTKKIDRPANGHGVTPAREQIVSLPFCAMAGASEAAAASRIGAERGSVMTLRTDVMFAPPTATILVVDDEPFLRIVLAEALVEAGYIVIEAESAEVAIDMLQAHPTIDVLITDINLDSAFDGHEVALKAQRRFPHLKVILMTGDLIPDEQFGAKPAIADGFLCKPFRLDDMWQLVESLFDRPNPGAG